MATVTERGMVRPVGRGRARGSEAIAAAHHSGRPDHRHPGRRGPGGRQAGGGHHAAPPAHWAAHGARERNPLGPTVTLEAWIGAQVLVQAWESLKGMEWRLPEVLLSPPRLSVATAPTMSRLRHPRHAASWERVNYTGSPLAVAIEPY